MNGEQMDKERVLPYYAMILCGGIAFILAFSAFVQGKELQAIFLLAFVVLCVQLVIFFKLKEIESDIKKRKNN